MSPALACLAAATLTTLTTLATLAAGGCPAPEPSGCEVFACTEGGWVCGLRRRTATGHDYASFLAVPYAKQPLGELRFKELQPVAPWNGTFHAVKPGPVCPQTDVLYKGLKQARGGMSEACIHANVHVPLGPPAGSPAGSAARPIFVFVHGGGFAFGSGDEDLHGPDYFVAKGIMVVTFNYRLNILGFLSLNSRQVPGNGGVRDAVTLLRWVRRNALAFGGDAGDVTLAGQSAGAVIAHILALNAHTNTLFNRVICMSGVATSAFYSSSPQFAATAAALALQMLAIDPALPPEVVHRRLIDTPVEVLQRVNHDLINIFGLTTFVPVVESPHEGVTPMLAADPEELLRAGAGRELPMAVGFTDAECETFVPRLREFDIVARLNDTPTLAVPPGLAFLGSPSTIPQLLRAVDERYFNGSLTGADGAGDAGGASEAAFVRYCTEAYYVYPALRVVETRVTSAPHTYLYKFSYGGVRSAVKEALGLRFAGAGHVEDLTYVLAAAPPAPRPPAPRPPADARVQHHMTTLFLDFMSRDKGAGGAWLPAGARLQYARVSGRAPHMRALTPREQDTKSFFDDLYELAAP